VRSRRANVSTPAEINAPDPLRQAALHPCPQRILGFFAQPPSCGARHEGGWAKNPSIQRRKPRHNFVAHRQFWGRLRKRKITHVKPLAEGATA
jgi:hypothetical protein